MQRHTSLRKSPLEGERPMTGQLNPSKPITLQVCAPHPLPRPPGQVLNWCRGRPVLMATPNAKVFQKNIALLEEKTYI